MPPVFWSGQRHIEGWEEEIEWSSHAPTPYISRNWPLLLPGWSEPVGSVVLLLQRAPLPLVAPSKSVEVSKTQLRDRALLLGGAAVELLQAQGHLAALFDPKTGLPLFSSRGKSLDDVAVVQSLLGYRAAREGVCTRIYHPRWGFAVYPTTLLSTAPPAQIRDQLGFG